MCTNGCVLYRKRSTIDSHANIFRVVDRLVLVNGLPGAGKTTLATALAGALPATLVSKDAIKEALAIRGLRRVAGGVGRRGNGSRLDADGRDRRHDRV